jgi:hypothetical protein
MFANAIKIYDLLPYVQDASYRRQILKWDEQMLENYRKIQNGDLKITKF